jgi:predicted methyltransferase
VTWRGAEMVVMESIVICKPYKAENCEGGNKNSLTRVKEVLKNVRKKLKMSD